MTTSDENLLARIAQRDADAFAALYDRHAARLLGLLARLIPQRPEAEDVLQDVFWHVWTRASQFDPSRASAIVWLVVVARSRARDFLRRRRSAPRAESRGVDAVSADPHANVERAESAQVARNALAQLPVEQRLLISLAFLNGLTHEEIAAHESIPIGTVKTRIRRGMQRLREILSGPSKAVAS